MVPFVATLLFLIGCQKEGFLPGNQNSYIGKSIVSPPKQVNGLMQFASSDELYHYIDGIEEQLKDISAKGREPAEILDEIERSVGFFSMRKKLQN